MSKSTKRFTNIPCTLLARTGVCNVKHCGFKHSKDNIAVCQNYLNGTCEDHHCKLSHEPAPHRMPDCVHFLAGVCVSNSCVYRHATSLSKKAEICREFLKGFCNFGLACRNLHKFHCSSWNNTRTCSRGDSCWHYHDQTVKRNDRNSVPIPQPSSSTAKAHSSSQSSKGSSISSSTITYHRSGTTFNALNTATLNPLKYIRPVEPYVASSPFKKRKLVDGLAEILNNPSGPISSASTEISFSSENSFKAFYDEDKIEKTGFLPLVKQNKRVTMPQHSSLPDDSPKATKRVINKSPTKKNNSNTQNTRHVSAPAYVPNIPSKSIASGSQSSISSSAFQFNPPSASYKSIPSSSTIQKTVASKSQHSFSAQNRKLSKSLLCTNRATSTMKSFIDFDEDKFYGFLKKDGSMDYDGLSLAAEEILPRDFLYLLD